MYLNAFSNPSWGKWILPGAGLAWFLGGYFLLRDYGLGHEISLVDAFFFTLLFLASALVLNRVFYYYSPNRKNSWLLFFLPLALSGGGVELHAQLLSWWFADDEPEYLVSLADGFLIRCALVGITNQFLAVLAFVLYKLAGQEEMSRREAQLVQLSKEAELAQLRQQLQPHFLFNSLNSIHALVMSTPQQARDMVLLLSDFLRGTLRSEGQSWITLSDEIKYLAMYFDIERVRFGQRLRVTWEVNPEAEFLKIPPLLIQPLVENAVKYGVYGTLGEVNIFLRCRKDGNYLLVEVENPFDSQDAGQEGMGFGLS